MSVRETVKSVLLHSGALRLRQRPSVAVLGYHSVSEEPDAQSFCVAPGITTRADRFREQMRRLRRSFNPVTLDDVADWIDGRIELPRRSVVVTFDDGFADNFEVAAPIMEEFDIRGAFYLTVGSMIGQRLPWFCRTFYLFHRAGAERQVLTDPETGRRWNLGDPKENREAFVYYNYPCAPLAEDEQRRYVEKLESWFGYGLGETDAPRMMTFEQARQLRRRGHVIGNHSFSHGNLAHVPAETLRHEIDDAHDVLQRELGEPIRHFSYPHPCLDPQWNEATRGRTEQLGYRTAVLTRPGIVTRQTPPLLLPRAMIDNPDEFAFRWKLETALAGIMT